MLARLEIDPKTAHDVVIIESYRLCVATISERAYVTREIAGILDSLARDYPAVLADALDTRREHTAN